MGLLDNIDGDTILSGLLSAGAASGAKGPYLARVAAGLAQGERFKQGRAEQARQRSQDEMQAEYKQLLMRKAQMDIAQQERSGLAESQKAAEAARIDALIRNAGQVRGGMGAGLPAGTLPDDLSMPAQPALQRPGQIDPQYLVQQGAPFERVKQLMEAPNLGRAKVKNIETVSIDGKPMKVGIDEFGQKVAQIGMEWRPLKLQDMGGSIGTFDETNPSAGITKVADKTMTFGDRTAMGNLAVAQGNAALARERFAFDKAGGAEGGKPQLVDGQWVYKPSAQFPQGRVVSVPGMPDKPLNESQGAATNFGSRAMRAHEQMSALEAAGDGSPGSIKRFMTAATPGLGMGLDESMGTLTNWTQSKEQQLAEQAQRNFITAVLRKESGASISPGEFSTAAQIYFPQPNDTAEVKLQKKQTREDAIKGLQAQAGPGAKLIKQNAPSAGGASGSWGEPKFLGFE